MERLYDARSYGGLAVPQRLLDQGHAHHKSLRDVVDPDRMTLVAGDNQPTPAGIQQVDDLDRPNLVFTTTQAGDGFATHALSVLATANGPPVPTYYVEAARGDLTTDARVLTALDDLLRTGATTALSERAVSVPTGNG
jgi:hypothetical protein